MATYIEFESNGNYIAWEVDLSEQLIDGEREQGCWINRFDGVLDNMYIIAKGNILETVEATW